MRHGIFGFILLTATALNVTGEPAGRPPVELGVGVNGIRIADIDFLQPRVAGPALDLRATVPLTARFAVEALVTIDRATNSYERRDEGLYTLQIKQRIARVSTARTHVFLTYGATGNYARVSATRYAYTEADPPVFATVGAGVERTLGRYLGVRVDAQVMTVLYLPLAVRVSAGLSIPFGRY